MPLQLKLWQRRNWHWYLKYEHRWPHCSTVHPLWSESRASVLHIITSTGLHDTFTFSTAVSVSPLGTAAVIDGAEVLITPLQLALVPPPMAVSRVAFSSTVVAVAWGQVEGCEVLAGVTAGGELEVAITVEGALWEETAEEVAGVAGKERDGVQDHNPPLQARPSAHPLQITHRSCGPFCVPRRGMESTLVA
jgi:hypothetical protein